MTVASVKFVDVALAEFNFKNGPTATSPLYT